MTLRWMLAVPPATAMPSEYMYWESQERTGPAMPTAPSWASGSSMPSSPIRSRAILAISLPMLVETILFITATRPGPLPFAERENWRIDEYSWERTVPSRIASR